MDAAEEHVLEADAAFQSDAALQVAEAARAVAADVGRWAPYYEPQVVEEEHGLGELVHELEELPQVAVRELEPHD